MAAASASVKNIYVQLLPVIKSGLGKVLLVKWNHGNFNNRWTGMIKVTDFQANTPPSFDALRDVAKDLIPCGVKSLDLIDLRLAAILEFTDPPACDEYVFVATLDSTTPGGQSSEPIEFENSPCSWFDWDKIPFHEMPSDDELWYPKVLQEGKLMRGSFTFGSWEEKGLKNYWVKEVDGF